MSVITGRSDRKGMLAVAVYGTDNVCVRWLHEDGAIDYEIVYFRPCVDSLIDGFEVTGGTYESTDPSYPAKCEVWTETIARLRKENAALRARMKSDAAYF